MENAKKISSSNNNKMIEKEDQGIEHMGSPVHSQVRKIKQESTKIIDWSPGQSEMRPVLREITRHHSRSPLGISC